jgi:putative flippase GtrA
VTEETLALSLPWHVRLRLWAVQPSTWTQVGAFLAVGAIGYVVNLAAYAVALHGLAIDYRTAATLAFGLALTTTFVLNRRYTFAAGDGAVHRQAWRYALVNALGFATNLVTLQLLVEHGQAPKLTAEALAAVVAAPVNYAGQRLWAFARRH